MNVLRASFLRRGSEAIILYQVLPFCVAKWWVYPKPYSTPQVPRLNIRLEIICSLSLPSWWICHGPQRKHHVTIESTSDQGTDLSYILLSTDHGSGGAGEHQAFSCGYSRADRSECWAAQTAHNSCRIGGKSFHCLHGCETLWNPSICLL